MRPPVCPVLHSDLLLAAGGSVAQGLVVEAEGLVVEAEGLVVEAEGLGVEAEGSCWFANVTPPEVVKPAAVVGVGMQRRSGSSQSARLSGSAVQRFGSVVRRSGAVEHPCYPEG